MLRVNAGIEMSLSASFAFRVALQRGTHGGISGPHLITLGFEHRFRG
jgi:hypothetical protein